MKLHVPKEGVSHDSEQDAPVMSVPGLVHRSLSNIILNALKQERVKDWHFIPHKLYRARDPGARASPSSLPHSRAHT